VNVTKLNDEYGTHAILHLQVVEKFTAHYVFALGLSRFFSCAHWLLQVKGAGALTDMRFDWLA
jgi:hypothetical protein